MRLTKTRRPLQAYSPKGPDASRPDDLGTVLVALVAEAPLAPEAPRSASEGDTFLPRDLRSQRIRRR